MSKYGGSEKTTQAFVAAYNKPRGSRPAPLGRRRPPASSSARGGRVFPAPPPSRRSASRPHPGQRGTLGGAWGSGYREDSLCWMLRDPLVAGSLAGVPPPSSTPRRPQNKSSSLCPLTPQLLHPDGVQFFISWRAPASPPLPVFSFLAASREGRIRLFEGW